MPKIIELIQISSSVLLIIAILLQQRGSGGSAILGSGGASYYSKRGFEKWLFMATIIFGALFVITSLLAIYNIR